MKDIHANIYSAIDADVAKLGGSGKVGQKLWPVMDSRKAQQKLLNSLNPEHSQKLDLEELLFIMVEARRRGSSEILFFLCDATSMVRPQAMDQDEQLAMLAETVHSLTEALTVTSSKIDQLLKKRESH